MATETSPHPDWEFYQIEPSNYIFSPYWEHVGCPNGKMIEPEGKLIGITFKPLAGTDNATQIEFRTRWTCSCGAVLDSYDYDYSLPEEAYQDEGTVHA